MVRIKLFTKPYLVVLLIVSYFFTQSCAYAFSIGDEKKVGEQLLYSVRAAFKVLDNPDISEYINSLGSEVLTVAGIQYFDYRFFVIQNDEFNAFAAPSGLVFFHTGLIKTMNNEDELVSVMAHEIGHVVRRHLASRMEKGKVVSMASLAVAVASLALGDPKATTALIAGSMAASQSANLHFSREDEEEADSLAYEWMKKLHRNPEYQASMLNTMRRITRYRSGQVPQYLLTHPNPEFRLDFVRSLLAVDHEKIKQYDENRSQFDFLRFKYRIMSLEKDNYTMRPYLAGIISGNSSSENDVVMAKYGLSQLNLQEKNFEAALENIESVIAHYPEKTILQIDKAIIVADKGDIDKGLSLLQDAYKKVPYSSYAAYHLGDLYMRSGQYSDAEVYYKQVALSMPEFSGIYFDLAKLEAKKKDKASSSFYLGEYYLYEGKLKLAQNSIENAMRDENLDKKMREKGEKHLELIKKLQKK